MNRIIKILGLGLGLLLLLANVSAQDLEKARKSLDKLGEVVISFEHKDIGKADVFAKLSIDKAEKNGRIVAYANQESFEWFLQQNIPWKYELHTSEMGDEPKMWDYFEKNTKAWDAYPTYLSYEALMYDFAVNFPHLCRIDTIGILPSGRKLLSAIISDNVNVDEDEPHFLYTATMHGDETTGYMLLLRLIDHVLNSYESDARIKHLVDNTVIHLNPLANPDGTFRGGNNTLALAIRYNGNFVDLNRNYKDYINGDNPDGNSWQPETIAFMDYAAKYPFVMAANFHGGIELVNYPWDVKYELTADNDWWFMVSKEYADTAKKYANYDGYFTGTGDGSHPGVTNGAGWYITSGNRQDYMNYFHHCREFTLEVSNTKKPNASTMPYFWDANYFSMLNYWEEVLFGFRGIVTDSISGEPLKAKVTLLQHDIDNSFVYSSLPVGNYHRPVKAGTYSLLFQSPGYCDKIVEHQLIQDRESKRIDVQMLTCPASVGQLTWRGVRFFPNPVTDFLNVAMEEGVNNAVVEIFSMDGRKVFSEEIHTFSRIDVRDFAQGVYYVSITESNRSYMYKMVKR